LARYLPSCSRASIPHDRLLRGLVCYVRSLLNTKILNIELNAPIIQLMIIALSPVVFTTLALQLIAMYGLLVLIPYVLALDAVIHLALKCTR